MIQDPAGLLERIPELAALCEETRIRKAVERGDPFKVYRALVRAKWTGKLKAHRPTLDALIGNRRLFARPTNGKLALGTVNSVGVSLVGADEPDPADSTSIATHALVVLFRVPVFPLGAYVVQSSGARTWRIFARVPLGALGWLYSRGVALALLAAAGVAAVGALHASGHQDVRIVNGFEVPLQIALAGQRATVAPGGMAVLDVPKGRQHGTATAPKGLVVDQVDLDVRPGTDVLAWNVAGAAPIYQERVRYTSDHEDTKDDAAPTVYCGQQILSLEGVDDAFKDPPATVRMGEGVGPVYRSHVAIDPNHGKPLDLCLSYLLSQGHTKQALPLLEAAAALQGWQGPLAQAALGIASFTDPEAAERFSTAARAAHPEDLDIQRAYQSARELNGHAEALRQEYEAAAQAAPDSASAQYLSARLLRGQAGIDAMERLLIRFPEDDTILRSVVYGRYVQGRWPAAVEAWETLRTRSPEVAKDVAEEGLTSLFAAGRGAQALTEDEALFQKVPEAKRESLAVLYAHLAQALHAETPAKLIEALEQTPNAGGSAPDEAVKRWDLRGRAGLPLEGAPADATAFFQKVRSDPGAALAAVHGMAPLELLQMGIPTWALLYAEAVRTNDAKARAALAHLPVLRPLDRERFERFVRGEEATLDPLDIPPPVHAAADVVRARNASLAPAERTRLLTEARALAPLEPTVTAATQTWKL